MRSGETIKTTDIYGKEVEINEVVLYPQLNKQKTMFWKVEGMFGSWRFTLCLTEDKQKAMEHFAEVNAKLLDAHEADLASRF